MQTGIATSYYGCFTTCLPRLLQLFPGTTTTHSRSLLRVMHDRISSRHAGCNMFSSPSNPLNYGRGSPTIPQPINDRKQLKHVAHEHKMKDRGRRDPKRSAAVSIAFFRGGSTFECQQSCFLQPPPSRRDASISQSSLDVLLTPCFPRR